MRIVVILSAVLAAVLAVVACTSSPPQRHTQHGAPSVAAVAAMGPIPTVVNAQRHAYQQPGPLSAYQLANTIHGFVKAGHYARRPKQLQQDATDAIQRLSAATANAKEDQAMLATWRGILLGDLGNKAKAMEELNLSLSIAPTNLAAGTLVTHFSLAGQMQAIFETCKSVAPVLTDPNERYQLTEHCMKNSRAISQAAALSWAPAKLVAWFHQETQRRQAAHAVYQQQQAADQARLQQQKAMDASRQQQIRANQARTRNNDAVATYACSQECRETAYDCSSECNGNGACEYGCSSRRDRCLRSCKN